MGRIPLSTIFNKTYTQQEVDYLLEEQAERTKQMMGKMNSNRREIHDLMMEAYIMGQANPNGHYTQREEWIEKRLNDYNI